MTKDEAVRLGRVEVQLAGLTGAVEIVAADVKKLLAAHERREGKEDAHSKISTRAWAAIAALTSLLSGGVGAVIVKKIG